MAKNQETVLTEVASRVGSALGIVAAEAAKIVRPLTKKGTKRSQRHSSAARKPRTRMNSMRRRATAGKRKARKRTSHNIGGRRA